MRSPYREIAKEALVNWNGLDEYEAVNKSQKETISELDDQVYAMSSNWYCKTVKFKRYKSNGISCCCC